MVQSSAILRKYSAKKGKTLQISYRCSISYFQTDSPIFERQKQYTKFLRSKEMAGVCSRFSLATDSEIEGLTNNSRIENTFKSTCFWLSMWINYTIYNARFYSRV